MFPAMHNAPSSFSSSFNPSGLSFPLSLDSQYIELYPSILVPTLPANPFVSCACCLLARLSPTERLKDSLFQICPLGIVVNDKKEP
jgi:hypothetical protein